MNRQQNLEDLVECWKASPHPSVKLSNYFQVYAELFGHLRGQPCTFVETGILDGGSLFMWRNWLGPQARIVGIDLNPEAGKWREAGFEIHIGDQGDPRFWVDTFRRIGEFDAFLDDGGHQSFQQIVTAQAAIIAATKKCVVAVEDTATSYMSDFATHAENSFLQYAKDSTDNLIGKITHISPGRFIPMINTQSIDFFRSVYSVQFYSGLVAFLVDPAAAVPAQVVRNHPANGASDFRHQGETSAVVEWPTPFYEKVLKVNGKLG